MGRAKRETVSISFHLLQRGSWDTSGEFNPSAFPEDVIDVVERYMERRKGMDLSDPDLLNRIRYRLETPIDFVRRADANTLYGRFRASYWGHSYANTARGEIPADSISLRPFCFMVYLSKRGGLYIATQYLGQFGGYGAISNSIRNAVGGENSLYSQSFRVGGSYYRDFAPKEVRISFFDKADSIASDGRFGSAGMVVFQRQKDDQRFDDVVMNRLLPAMGRPASEVKRTIAALTEESELISFDDADVEECSIVAIVNGRRKTISLLGGRDLATKFPVDVPIMDDGHPEPDPVFFKMAEILRRDILSRSSGV